MAALTASSEPNASRPQPRTRPSATDFARQGTASPSSPRTPTVGRTISGKFNSPGAFREQDDIVIYELGARHFSAGFAGESKPRCIIPFTPDDLRRVGDFRQYDAEYVRNRRKADLGKEWGEGYVLYNLNLAEQDLGIVQDRLERVLRKIMVEHLQLDTKPRKAILTAPSMLPTPLVETALRVLFGHFTQPPSISLLTHPAMCCIASGLRHALVIDIGWEETVVTAVGEYKEVAQRRSIRAGRRLTREMGNVLEQGMRAQGLDNARVTFAEAEDITQRVAWCRPREESVDGDGHEIELPIPATDPPRHFMLPFDKLADPAEKALFASESPIDDDHELPLQVLAFRVLFSLPQDFRALCESRVILTGGISNIPGLKQRLLQELEHLIETRTWNPISNYGSAKRPLGERSVNLGWPKVLQENRNGVGKEGKDSPPVPLSPTKMPLQETIPHADRKHDDIKDPITIKADSESSKGKERPVFGTMRGVETLGPWAGASLVASLRVKSVHEIEREDFFRNGLRNGAADL
ncbi:Hypothetical predicted protein [Lecanosticta acicola]|uniref:Actin-like ATPase domain-containing protein n=1 Tax=Lecanosticta acicola TaxID=111012 RepID=A0AAI8YR36_9PEZI|nr:Hypothetical predicted protein [Lecanosticta acicola]